MVALVDGGTEPRRLGHGLSAPGSNGIGRLQAADDLATLLEQLDLRDAIVMGHSMGGMILG
ncbi:MAG: alpha/beta fold hydrolase, partial [Acidimicrobiales bacterium]